MKNSIMWVLLLFAISVFYWGFLNWFNTPIVFQSNSKRVPVSCSSEDTDWQERNINDLKCQTVLQGKYEMVWVE